MKRIFPKLNLKTNIPTTAGMLALVVLLSITLSILLTRRGIPTVLAAPVRQAALPSEGWQVCQDLGIVGGVQHMLVCHGDGWEIDAYCLQMTDPAPPVGSFCSLVDGTNFWCGDEDYQLLTIFQIQQTAAPTSTPAPSATPTATATATATNTLIPTATAIVATSTGVVGAEEISPSDTPTPTPAATRFVRPHAGGNGVAEPLAAGLAALAGLVLIAAASWLGRRR